MSITIKDVAARAGVSVTTVSKILNRRPGISEETTQRVEQVMRELEYAHYDFELVMDQGAYFEFKRHRMMTQTAQPLTTRLGYAVPRAMSLAGVESLYRQAMDAAAELYEALSGVHSEAAAYVVPNGYNRRVLCRMNLRELFHFTKLRASANAHFSIRRAALRMAELG